MSTITQAITATANWFLRVTENFRSVSPAALYGIDPATTTGLTLGYLGGNFNDISFANGTVAITASNTNYVVAHRTTGAVTAATNTTNWLNTSTYLQLYEVVAGASTMTSIDDKRQAFGGTGGGGGGSTDWGDLTSVPAPIEDIAALTDPGADCLLFWDDSAGEYTHLTIGSNLSITGTTINASGGGGSTQGKQTIPIMAGGMRPSIAGGCSAIAAIASAANQPDIVSLDFDPSAEEFAQFAIPMPKKWNEGTITARFRWSHAATTTNFSVVWTIQAVAVGDDDAIAVSFGTAQDVTDVGGTTNDLYISAETSAMSVGGTPAAGDTVFFRVSRDAPDGSDTLAIDARLHGVDIFITTDADTDA